MPSDRILTGEDLLAYENLVMRVFLDGIGVFNRETGCRVLD